MKYIDGIIVVEGSNDASYVSSFVDVEIVILNGYDKRNLEYLKQAQNFTTIYLLTDPDAAGEDIRKEINKEIKCVDINIDGYQCSKHGKHGVAECSKTELLSKLKPYMVDEKPTRYNTLTLNDIYLIKDKDKLCERFNIGKCNNKKIIERLNRLRINKEQLYGN